MSTPIRTLTQTELQSTIVRNPLIVTAETTVLEAIAKMSETMTICAADQTGELDQIHQYARSSCVLVMESEKIIGLMTERDVVRLSAQPRSLEAVPLRDVITSPVVTLREADFTDLFLAVNLLQQHRISHLPILDRDDRLLGLITHESLRPLAQPVDLYTLSKVLEQRVSQLEAEKLKLTENYTAELERQVAQRMADLHAKFEREQLIAKISTGIAALFSLPAILKVSVQELRSFLDCDRMLIWQLQPDGSGMIVSESVGAGWRASLDDVIDDPCFRGDIALKYGEGRTIAITNIHQAKYPNCYVEMLDAYQVKSNLVVPIHVSGKLWGLLVGHQCADYREWQDEDLGLLNELAVQIAIAIQQAAAYEQAQIEQTERKRTETALREIEQRFISLAAAAPVGIFRTDTEGKCLYVNERWCQMAGLTPAEAAGFGWINAIHPRDRELVSAEWDKSVQARRTFHLEYRFFNDLKQQITWVFGQSVAERNESGEIIGYVGTITDITDRRQAEILRQENEERLSLALTASNQGLYDLNLKTGEAIVNPEYALMLGYDPLTFQETNAKWLERIHPDDQEAVANIYQAYVAQEIPEYKVEFRQRTQTGAWKSILSLGKIVAWDEWGHPVRMIGTHTDISDRKKAEMALQQLNQELEDKVEERTQALWQVNSLQRAILDGADYAFISTDLNGVIQTFNEAAVRMLGYSANEVIGKVTPAIIHEPQEVIDKAATLSVELGQDIPIGFEVFVAKASLGLTSENEWTYIRKDGSRFPVLLSVTALKDIKQQIIGFLGIAQDISDRKQAEVQLRNLSDRLTLATNSAALGIWDWDVTQNILVWDDRMYELYGITPNRFTSIYEDWSNRLHPDDRSATELAIQQALTGEKDYEPEFRVVHPDGTIHFIQGYALVQRNVQGEAQRMVGINVDITDRKLAESQIQQTTAQLLASNQELEAFAYSVSHDLRAPLRAIDGFSNALMEDYGDKFDAEARDYFDRIRRNINRMGMLIDGLLRLSRVSRSEMQYIDVNLSALVQEQVKELQVLEPERKVEVIIMPNIFVSADLTLMRVVINNLVQNAWKFTSHHASSRIEFGVMPQEDQLIYFIRDDGAGFDMSFAKMLFGVFQRLHNTNEFTGTGIGLAIVQRAIHRHGGKVWAEGYAEKGATIYFTVPHTSPRNKS